MTSVLVKSFRTPVRPAEPVTLVGKLKARQRELDALWERYDALKAEEEYEAADALIPQLELADRRITWALGRKEDAVDQMARIYMELSEMRSAGSAPDLVNRLLQRRRKIAVKLHG